MATPDKVDENLIKMSFEFDYFEYRKNHNLSGSIPILVSGIKLSEFNIRGRYMSAYRLSMYLKPQLGLAVSYDVSLKQLQLVIPFISFCLSFDRYASGFFFFRHWRNP